MCHSYSNFDVPIVTAFCFRWWFIDADGEQVTKESAMIHWCCFFSSDDQTSCLKTSARFKQWEINVILMCDVSFHGSVMQEPPVIILESPVIIPFVILMSSSFSAKSFISCSSRTILVCCISVLASCLSTWCLSIELWIRSSKTSWKMLKRSAKSISRI